MFKLRLAAAAAIACAVTLLSSGAQAYPDCGIALSLDIDDATLVGGESFTFTADAGDVNCDPWTVTYRGQTKVGSGTSFSGSYSTPVVSKKKKTVITAKCTHEILDSKSLAPASDSPSTVTPAVYSAAPRAAALPSRIVTCPVSATVTLLPKGVDDGDDGSLPNTGGSNLWLLVLGGALVIGGGGVTYAARRRHSSH